MEKTLMEGFVLGQIGVIVFKFPDEIGCALSILKRKDSKENKAFFMSYIHVVVRLECRSDKRQHFSVSIQLKPQATGGHKTEP